MAIKRGKIYLANLDPVIGAEMNNVRPVVVISNNINNRFSKTITILPITSNTSKIYPFEIFLVKGVANLPKDSKVRTDQIRTIDKSRLIKELGQLHKEHLANIEKGLCIHLSLPN